MLLPQLLLQLLYLSGRRNWLNDRHHKLHPLHISNMLSLATAVPTFVCSSLSFIASSIFAVSYIMYPPERHFRQAMIVNLLVSGMLDIYRGPEGLTARSDD